MTREELRDLDFGDIADVIRFCHANGLEAFDDIYRVDDKEIEYIIKEALERRGALGVKWLLEDVKTNCDDSFVRIDGYGNLVDVDENYFEMCKEELEKELENMGYFEEEEEEEEE